ncbi:MAG: GNAT family N-acetyltransferase [Bacteroidia bacterium]|nr:GNAT family N-acetyltransferase [Bacteroidia bacterium]
MLTFNFTPFPVLETQRLCLRAIVKEDAENLFCLRSEKEVMKYINRPLPASVDEIYTLIEKIQDGIKTNQAIAWAITLKAEPGKIIGTIGYHRINAEDHRGEIGYMLDKNYWRKGLVQEAMEKIIDYGFKEMKFHSMEGIINPANIASAKILEKNNFVREAYFKENYHFNGEFLDSAIYSLLNPYKGK